MRKAVFLDRDGTINIDTGYVSSIEEFSLIDGVLEALQIIQRKNFKIFIVTNQSGIARGFFSKKEYLELENQIHETLLKEGIQISETAFCPYFKKGSIYPYTTNEKRRKPSPLMIQELAKKHHIYLRESYVVGDAWSDIESGWRAGVTSVGVQTGKEPLLFGLKKVRSYPSLLEFSESL